MIAPDTTGSRVIVELERRGFKRRGNEWRGNSPLRAGSDSKSFVARVEDDGEHGTWHDHVTGESGSLYQLAERMGIEIKRAQAQETKRPYTSLEDYATAHYAPASAFAAAGWQEGTHKGRPCLIYKVGGKLRYRFTDGQTPPYEWEKGGTAAWYGLKRAIEMAAGRALILCNGEASTIAAQHHGLPACAWAGGEQKLPDVAIAELIDSWPRATNGMIAVAYDCDPTGMRAADAVGRQLTEAGYDIRIVDLGMTEHGDLADFCGLWESAAYDELIRRAVLQTLSLARVAEDASRLEAQVKAAQADPQQAIAKQAARLEAQVERIQELIAPPRIRELHELAAEILDPQVARRWPSLPIPELAALVGPLEPELYVLLGATGMGKSWLAASIAAALTHSAGAGLVVTTETSPRNFMERMASYVSRVSGLRVKDGLASAQDRGSWLNAVERFKGYEGWVMDLSSPTPAQVEAAAKRAREKVGMAWILVDSASRMNGPDGVYERMTGIANALQNMARDFYVPVIVTSQIGRDVTDRAEGKKQPRLDDGYGSGAIEHNAGVVVGLYRREYYVQKELESPDDVDYPPNTARLILLKHRNRPVPDTPYCTVRYEGGCGFYPYQSRIINLNGDAD